MALDAKIVGDNGGLGVNSDTYNNLNVTLPQVLAASGYNRPMSEVDAGNVTGVPKLLAAEVSEDYRARVEFDSLWDDEKFNYTAQNTSKHKYYNTTMTNTWGGGFVTTNSGNSTAINTGTLLATYRYFPVYSAAETYLYFKVQFTGTWAVTNTTIDIGLFTSAITTPYAPTDGAYIRANSSGLFLVANVNGTEQTSSPFLVTAGGAQFVPTIGKTYDVILTTSDTAVICWMDLKDGNGMVVMARLSPATTVGVPLMAGSAPFSIRHAIGGTAASAVINCKIAKYTITQGGTNTNRLWASVMAGMGNSSIQGASGHTQGQTANNANSTVPATATLSNTAASYTTLGGRFLFAATAGAETDYALFAFQVPAPTTAITGRNLIIRGIWVDTYNAVVAVATTPTVLEWSLAVGSTAVSLATSEAATTRAPRRVSLGCQTFVVGDAAGKQAPRLDVNLDAPVVAEPSTFVHVILRIPYGTATATELFRGQVGINAYWE